MKWRNAIWSVLCTGLLAAHAADPRTTLDTGTEAYRAKQFEAAKKAFFEAATNAVNEKLDPAVAKYNEGSAAYRLGRTDEAAERLAEALRTSNLPLQQRAWYNRGDALLGQMAAQEKQGKLEEAQKLAGEAATHFEQAILLDPSDTDAKVNYELSLRLQQEMEKKKQEQEKQQQQDQNQKQDKDKDKDKKDQQDKKQEQPQKPDDKQKQDPQSKPDQNQQQQQQQTQAEKKDNEMTPEEALQLLNAMRQEEQAQRDKLRLNIGQPEPVEKDW